jgi:invasion protein IalB
MKLHACVFLTVSALAALSTVPAAAQQRQAPSNPNGAKKILDPNEVVCEKQEVLGSRLATKRVCMTRAEWAELRHQDRQDLERVQTMRGMQDQ